MVGRTAKYGSDRAADVIGSQARAETEMQWGEMSGQVIAVDHAKGTATIRPAYKKRLNGEPTQIPDLVEVPFHEGPRSTQGGFTAGSLVGAMGTLRPKMANSEAFHVDGGEFAAEDARRSSLSDMEFYLDGGDSLSAPLKNRDPDNAHMRFDADGQYGLKGSPDGKVRLDGAEGNVYTLLAQVVRLLATDGLQIQYGSSTGSGHELQHRAAYDEIADKLEAMAL